MIARLRGSGLAVAATLWLVAGSCVAFAQAAPPAATDEALRARVTEFLQGFVDRKFTKLIPLVAEDTQEEFIGMGKTELKSYNIDKIEYESDFTRATVKLKVVKIWRWEGNELLPQVPMDLTWKIENGKWVWYHELKDQELVTPMGPSEVSKIMQQAQGGTLPQMPRISAAVMDKTGASLMNPATIDKSEITLANDRQSSEAVQVKNGAQGKVTLSLVGLPSFDGFKVSLDNADVEAGKVGVVHVSFDASASPNPPPSSTTFSVLVTPFNQQFPVTVKFAPSPK